MVKKEKIQQIYAIVLGLFIVAVSIALICVAADIYFSNRDSGVIFTRERVAERLRAFIAPFVILIVAIAAGIVFPLYDVRARVTSEHTAKLLETKLPAGGVGEEYETALARYNKLNTYRIALWSVTGALLLACIIATLCYMLNTAHFLSENITGEIFALVQHVLPWVITAFVVLIVAAALSGIIAKKRVTEIKTLIRLGNREPSVPTQLQRFVEDARKLLNSNVTLWVVRGVVFAVAVTFIVLGAN